MKEKLDVVFVVPSDSPDAYQSLGHAVEPPAKVLNFVKEVGVIFVQNNEVFRYRSKIKKALPPRTPICAAKWWCWSSGRRNAHPVSPKSRT